MDYTDAMIRRLRDRLMRYRTENRIRGRKRPWHRVAQDIADADTVPREFYDREDNFDVLGEALRRFEAGLQVPSRERLDAIRIFLIEKRYLDADGDDETATPQRLIDNVRGFLGGDQPCALPETALGCFIAEQRRGGRGYVYRVVSIMPAENGTGVFEESIHKTAMAARTRDASELRRFFQVAATATQRRDGWVLAGRNGQLLMLVKDRITGETEIGSFVTNTEAEELYRGAPLQFLDGGTEWGFIPSLDNNENAQAWLSDNHCLFVKQER